MTQGDMPTIDQPLTTREAEMMAVLGDVDRLMA